MAGTVLWKPVFYNLLLIGASSRAGALAANDIGNVYMLVDKGLQASE
ncbi:hypothetical protein ACFSUS_12710 [Spirosoma soli]|uniref:Uncharacterized protein n=1 Tax=Spirosoma soli TaxID=1770529 RepID=A0ABW5M4K1_9BACT